MGMKKPNSIKRDDIVQKDPRGSFTDLQLNRGFHSTKSRIYIFRYTEFTLQVKVDLQRLYNRGACWLSGRNLAKNLQVDNCRNLREFIEIPVG